MHRVLSFLCSIALLLLSVGPPAFSQNHPSHSDTHHVHGSRLGAASALAHVLGVTSQISQNRATPAAWTELAHHLVHYRDTQNNANLIAQGKHPPHHTELWTLTGWAHVGALASQFGKNWKNPTAWTELFHHAMHASSGMDALLKPDSRMGRIFANPLFPQLSAVGALAHSMALISQMGKNWKNPAAWTDLFLHLVELRDFQDLLKPILGPLAETQNLIGLLMASAVISIPLAKAASDQEKDKSPEEPSESILDAIDLMNRRDEASSGTRPELIAAQNKMILTRAATVPAAMSLVQPLTSSYRRPVIGNRSADAAYISFFNAQGHSNRLARKALHRSIASGDNKYVN